jgi:hypothetical protein
LGEGVQEGGHVGVRARGQQPRVRSVAGKTR